MKKILGGLLLLIGAGATLSLVIWFSRPDDLDFGKLRAKVPHAEYSHFTDIDNVRIHYQEKGSGPVLVLIHGNNSSTYTWKDIFDGLAAKFRVIALDLKGFSFSGKPEGDYTMPAQAALVIGLLDTLKVDRAILCGNSMGGSVALMCAINYPQRVEGSILADAAAFNDFRGRARIAPGITQWPIVGPPITAMALTSDFLVRRALQKSFVDKSKVTAERVAYYYLPLRTKSGQQAARLVREQRDNSPIERSLDQVKQPTLIIWGNKDLLIPLNLGRRLHEKIAGSRFVVFENCGHLPQEEMPDRFLQTVLQFATERFARS